jgi:hypothetical protein
LNLKTLGFITLVLAAAFPLASRAQKGKAHPANLDLAQRAARAAAERVVGDIPPGSRILGLVTESSRPLDWVVEEALMGALDRAGFQVFRTAPGGDSSAFLRCRTVDVGLTYQEKAGGVERIARVRIAYHLTQGDAGRVLASGDDLGTAQDVVTASALPGLEGPELVPVWLKAREGLGSRLVEPALISAVVAGLIYLFYSSKASR